MYQVAHEPLFILYLLVLGICTSQGFTAHSISNNNSKKCGHQPTIVHVSVSSRCASPSLLNSMVAGQLSMPGNGARPPILRYV